jgi:hypothetical protein
MKKEMKYDMGCLFHWVEVNSTWNDKMVFNTAQFKMDHGLEYAHFERVKRVNINYNLCGYCLN